MTEEIKYNKCCCYENDKCLWTKRYYENNIVPDCEEVQDCYYKQLKRLEQENKELKEANQSLSILGTDLASASETVRKEFFRADKNKDMWREKAEKYRSALEEIKNDLKEVCKEECDYTKTKFCGDCDCRYGQILTKIEEVLNDSEG